jgi:2-iminobutanoate/2-iminopropanoate deaminase
MEIQPVFTANAPAPGGHYSQAMVYNGLVFVAGQLPIKPGSSEKTVGPIEEQAEQCLTNLREILRAAGSDMNRLLKVTIYVSDINLWGKVNEVYTRMLGEHRPARAIVPCKELHYGFQIEIEAIAALNGAPGNNP